MLQVYLLRCEIRTIPELRWDGSDREQLAEWMDMVLKVAGPEVHERPKPCPKCDAEKLS